MRYRTKPLEVEAIEYDGTNTARCLEFMGKGWTWGVRDVLQIRTHLGYMRAHPGDWIVKGPYGEIQIVDAATFAATYEEVL